jgi:hypothetical protein
VQGLFRDADMGGEADLRPALGHRFIVVLVQAMRNPSPQAVHRSAGHRRHRAWQGEM